ncbi:tRNA-splicing endonuclease subunit Sen34-like [Macrosteles quadrilineatus]|uniref:tRNA-splicing endonuclease subunit Sen34-like n=1 Tax=Macrosteles quadrilineatus TaxID=74068 RepID=UPI0023E203DA|nr:tRNA-splicing endonuclease subunit Sen34-like [Macrosteles quadrilineatus]
MQREIRIEDKSLIDSREITKIIIQNGSGFIWNADDWLKLREDHRIVGNLTGCLVGLPRQETLQGLPLVLLPEEVTLLVEKKVARLIDDSILTELPPEQTKERYISYKEQNKKEQMDCYEDQRRQQVTSMIDRIIDGKRRKLLGLNTKKRKRSDEGEVGEEKIMDIELDREEILKNELNKSAENFSPPVLVQTFTSEQWLGDTDTKKVIWKFPESDHEKLKYFVFRDLWEKGYYITDGHKFGVDYLVYPGDPVKFHAQFLIVCIESNSNIPPSDLIAYARLGSTSRKTFVIASKLPDKEDIFYSSFQWNEKS